MKKSVSFFFISIVLLFISLGVLEWAHDTYFDGLSTSPILRIKTIVLIIVGIIIMKLTLSDRFFKIFLISYLLLWILFYFITKVAVNWMTSYQFNQLLNNYTYYTQLLTPLPLILFWFFNKMLLSEGKKREKNAG